MNKKIILCGTIIGILACLFPPFGQYINGNFLAFGGWHFITFTGLNSDGHYELANFVARMIAIPYLITEILGIAIATFGFAYYLGGKTRK